ncbi:MAG: GAP family protein [Mycobacterium sp.]|nr:GAP family protein [Mycobacterium sp.]
MWTTVLVLATALNLEPNRLALIALMLVRPHPIRQLLAFLAGSFLTSAVVGLLILFALARGAWAGTTVNGAKVQIAIGALAIGAALFLATNAAPNLLGGTSSEGTPARAGLAGVLANYVGKIVEGSSPWFAAALGVGLVALPSVDYIALLVLIAASELPLSNQAGVLLTFLSVANAILLIPIASYLVDPTRTSAALERLRDWVLARRRRDYAVLLGVIGCVMIAVGVRGL